MHFSIETIFLNLTIFICLNNIIATNSILLLKKPLCSALYPEYLVTGYQNLFYFHTFKYER